MSSAAVVPLSTMGQNCTMLCSSARVESRTREIASVRVDLASSQTMVAVYSMLFCHPARKRLANNGDNIAHFVVEFEYLVAWSASVSTPAARPPPRRPSPLTIHSTRHSPTTTRQRRWRSPDG